MECTVKGLFVYPLKSASGISAPELNFVTSGPQWDRHWILTKPNGQFVTQRTHPKMAQIQCSFVDQTLKVSLPTGDFKLLPLVPATEGELKPISIFGKKASGAHVGIEFDQWFSSFLGSDVQLLQSSEKQRRTRISKIEEIEIPIDFADGYPVLLVNQSSVNSFKQSTGQSFGADRFRSNIVVEGLPAFEEDKIFSFSNKDVTFLAEKICTRCTMINVDQKKGTKSFDILSHLKKDRPSPKGPLFGQNLSVKVSGLLKVGQKLQCQVKAD